MNIQRKKIIISEIIYWKKSNLLPAHYCDFLITLYAGEQEEQQEEETAVLLRDQQRIKHNKWQIGSIVIGLGILLLATTFAPLILLSITAILILALLIIPFRSNRWAKQLTPVAYVASALLLLFMSLKIWSIYFNHYPMLLVGVLLANCALWLFTGRLLKMLHFTVAGAIGMLVIVGFLLFQ